MEDIRLVQPFDQIKILSDPRRLFILRQLMAKPSTLTQLGHLMGEHPAWVRHHLKQLEGAGLIELVSVQVSGGIVEKFYQATARVFILQQTILPDAGKENTLILMGSHDMALALLARSLAERAGLDLLALPVGSLDGLIALRQGLAHLSACHLLDTDSDEYNRPYVRRLLPDHPMKLVTLAHREQGLLVSAGNPRQVHKLEDLARGDLTFINRNPGSGTRLWLDKQLSLLGIPTDQIQGYAQEVRTHTAVAQAVAQGKADAGLGLAAAARQIGLDFIPLFQERFDLVIPIQSLGEARFGVMLDYLHSGEFRHMAENLGGYDTHHTGEEFSA